MCVCDSQTVMRLLDNCSLDADTVKGIMDDLNYYVDSNQVYVDQWCPCCVNCVKNCVCCSLDCISCV